MPFKRPYKDWKQRRFEELQEPFSIPFAVKEYMQNCVGQALKDLETTEWNGWEHIDLRNASAREREAAKERVLREFPGAVTGPFAGYIQGTKVWQPVYILTARIPADRIRRDNPDGTPL